ncbi:protein odr-4 homolog isoform X3 [Leucoraja erinacea]|uniref:protein odr-4 homolog isoform X3 n=1 Tax=Leucoraja erinaceus TaxID=7782 RepID=UPI0024590D5C|nr:protein odr-4 homolog isoform X3 [Leucoraja erinacea]
MGKTYLIGEYSEKYLKKLKGEERYGTTGVLLGQATPSKTYIIFAARTPLKDEAELPPDNPDEMNASDIEWMAEHARQVSRMLPGGILVLGIFLIRPAKMSKEEAQDIFRKTPPKLIDYKSSSLTSAWQLVEATINVDIHIPVAATAENQLEKNSLKGLNVWAKQMMQSNYLIGGYYKDAESIIGEGSKKKTPVEIQFLTSPPEISPDDTVAVIESCGSGIYVKGTVRCRAYLHGSKAKVKDAIQSLKRDVLNTVYVRCEMVCEDRIVNKGGDAGDSATHRAPHRVFASTLPSGVAFCDYGFSDEGSKDLEERYKELLDYDLHPAQLERVEETMLEEMGVSPTKEPELKLFEEEEEEVIIETGFKYTGMAAAAGVGVIAIAVSVIVYFIAGSV